MHCLICGIELNTCVCPRCSFDQSLCRELYPTLGADEYRPAPLYVHRDALYRKLEDALASWNLSEEECRSLSASLQEKQSVTDELTARHEALSQDLCSITAERDKLQHNLNAAQAEQDDLRKKFKIVLAERDNLRRNAASSPAPTEHPILPKDISKSPVNVGTWLVRIKHGRCTILGSTIPLSGSVVIPHHLADSLVVAIADSAFECSGLTALSIPKTVICIGKAAFRNCKQLILVSLSYETKIEAEAFSGCRKLLRVNYPSVSDERSYENNIDPTAFLNTNPHLVIAAAKGSAPFRFATEQCYTASTQTLDNLFAPPSDLL